MNKKNNIKTPAVSPAEVFKEPREETHSEITKARKEERKANEIKLKALKESFLKEDAPRKEDLKSKKAVYYNWKKTNRDAARYFEATLISDLTDEEKEDLEARRSSYSSEQEAAFHAAYDPYEKAYKSEKALTKKYKDEYTILYDRVKYAYVSYRPELIENHTILSLRHVKQFFNLGGGIKTKAVHDVSFDIKEGEVFGLVGESGCGKTTTGRSIIGLYNITSGSIYYKGYRINGGTRWNEKEIKWSKIHTLEKVRILQKEKEQALEEISSGEGLSPEAKNLQDKIVAQSQKMAKMKADFTSEYNEANNSENENNEAELADMKNKFEIAFAKEEASLSSLAASFRSVKEVKESVKGKDPKEVAESYDKKIKQLQEEEKLHVAEQKDIIKQIRYDDSHVNRNLVNEIQMIFQDPVDSLDPRMTVEDIIQEGLHIQHRYDKRENHEICVNMLRKVGLIPEYASRYPHEFSGGQRQRIGIARALVMNPKLLICDEPISALDVSIRAQILNLLNEIKGEMGLTMLFIAHDLSVVKYFCDRIAVMYFGNLVELASSDELFKHPLHPYTQALLSAIPKPDPLSEKNRVRQVYDPRTAHDYSVDKPTLVEILPGHFVLANKAEVEKYNSEIAVLDKKKEN